MATNEELEERLAALELRLGAAPLAANPPVTIGELTDVPAPGSAIASAWAQEVTNRAAHRFVSVADRNTKWPARAPGSLSYRADGPTTEFWDGTAWRQMQAPRTFPGLVADTTIAAGATICPASIGPVTYAGRYLCVASLYADSVGVIVARLHLSTTNSTAGSVALDTSASSTGYVQMTLQFFLTLAAGGTAYFMVNNGGGSPLNVKGAAAPLQSRCFATFGYDPS